jgi:uncharacterized membrane protein YozB (DUF420 family)
MEGKEEEKSFTERIYEHVEEYAKTTVELYRLKAIKVFSDVFAAVATGFIIWVIISFFLVFLSIGTAFWIGQMLGKWHYGFFIVAGFYALVGLIIYMLRVKCLKAKINNFIIRQIFKN